MNMDGDGLQAHYKTVISEMAEGGVTPLLGAGVNLCGRPENANWERKDLTFAPSGGELAGYLARRFDYPQPDGGDLLEISQWVFVEMGDEKLYRELREIFVVDYEPSALHHFLARLPAALKAKGAWRRHQAILTTNYDDALERAFREAQEPFDLLSYIAVGDDRGKFQHTAPDGSKQVIHTPNEYTELSLDERTVIVKIHGDVDRAAEDYDDVEGDSYVITEDDYVDYLTRSDIATLLPKSLQKQLQRSSFLFLGYSLSDWNLRVILQRIRGQQKRSANSWAIQVNPQKIQQTIWRDRKVEILDLDLDVYVAGLEAQLALPLNEGVA
jgi:hypothetical protein